MVSCQRCTSTVVPKGVVFWIAVPDGARIKRRSARNVHKWSVVAYCAPRREILRRVRSGNFQEPLQRCPRRRRTAETLVTRRRRCSGCSCFRWARPRACWCKVLLHRPRPPVPKTKTAHVAARWLVGSRSRSCANPECHLACWPPPSRARLRVCRS